jgi:hypothetical protein
LRKRVLLALVVVLLVSVGLLSAQSTIRTHTEIYNFINGLRVAGQTFAALSGSSNAITLGHTSATSVTITSDGGSLAVDGNATLNSIGLRVTPPAAQTIASGDTVAADACLGVKRVTAAGAVTTSTTNTFTAPAAANAGCWMLVCNTGSNTITLDNNSNFKSIGGADIALTADDCTAVVSDGTVWRSAGSLVAN